ncbi:MAG: hypothetical protein WDW38_001062 [Sanguina aurantia]
MEIAPSSIGQVGSVGAALLPEGAKGLVFDCDGTLLDSMQTHFEAWRHTCRHFGIKLSAQTMVALAGKPVNEILDLISGTNNVSIDRQAFFDMKSQYYLDHAKEVAVIESVVAIAREGAARGLPMAVASGGCREHVMEGLTSTGLLGLFAAVVCAEDVQRGKPAPDCFLLAASMIGVAPEVCVGYEDAVLGMESIVAAGFMAAIDVTKALPDYPHLVDDDEPSPVVVAVVEGPEGSSALLDTEADTEALLHALEAADSSAATARGSIFALEQALLEANRRLVEAGQQQVYSADFLRSHAGDSTTQSKRDGQQDQNSGRMQQGSVDHRAGPPPPETVDPTQEQAVTRSLGIATPAPSLDAVVLQYERELRAMDLIVRQHEASLAAQSQQVQSMQLEMQRSLRDHEHRITTAEAATLAAESTSAKARDDLGSCGAMVAGLQRLAADLMHDIRLAAELVMAAPPSDAIHAPASSASEKPGAAAVLQGAVRSARDLESQASYAAECMQERRDEGARRSSGGVSAAAAAGGGGAGGREAIEDGPPAAAAAAAALAGELGMQADARQCLVELGTQVHALQLEQGDVTARIMQSQQQLAAARALLHEATAGGAEATTQQHSLQQAHAAASRPTHTTTTIASLPRASMDMPAWLLPKSGSADSSQPNPHAQPQPPTGPLQLLSLISAAAALVACSSPPRQPDPAITRAPTVGRQVCQALQAADTALGKCASPAWPPLPDMMDRTPTCSKSALGNFSSPVWRPSSPALCAVLEGQVDSLLLQRDTDRHNLELAAASAKALSLALAQAEASVESTEEALVLVCAQLAQLQPKSPMRGGTAAAAAATVGLAAEAVTHPSSSVAAAENAARQLAIATATIAALEAQIGVLLMGLDRNMFSLGAAEVEAAVVAAQGPPLQQQQQQQQQLVEATNSAAAAALVEAALAEALAAAIAAEAAAAAAELAAEATATAAVAAAAKAESSLAAATAELHTLHAELMLLQHDATAHRVVLEENQDLRQMVESLLQPPLPQPTPPQPIRPRSRLEPISVQQLLQSLATKAPPASGLRNLDTGPKSQSDPQGLGYNLGPDVPNNLTDSAVAGSCREDEWSPGLPSPGTFTLVPVSAALACSGLNDSSVSQEVRAWLSSLPLQLDPHAGSRTESQAETITGPDPSLSAAAQLAGSQQGAEVDLPSTPVSVQHQSPTQLLHAGFPAAHDDTRLALSGPQSMFPPRTYQREPPQPQQRWQETDSPPATHPDQHATTHVTDLSADQLAHQLTPSDTIEASSPANTSISTAADTPPIDPDPAIAVQARQGGDTLPGFAASPCTEVVEIIWNAAKLEVHALRAALRASQERRDVAVLGQREQRAVLTTQLAVLEERAASASEPITARLNDTLAALAACQAELIASHDINIGAATNLRRLRSRAGLLSL